MASQFTNEVLGVYLGDRDPKYRISHDDGTIENATLELLNPIEHAGTFVNADLWKEAGIGTYKHSRSSAGVHNFVGDGRNGRALITAPFYENDTATVNGIPAAMWVGESPLQTFPVGHWVYFIFDGVSMDFIGTPTRPIGTSNLLINSTFENGHPILNDGSGAPPECWSIYWSSGTGTISTTAAGINISVPTSGAASFYQRIELAGSQYLGSKLTLSAKMYGTVYRCTDLLRPTESRTITPWGKIGFMQDANDLSRIVVDVTINAGQSVMFQWIRLDVGDVQISHIPDNPAINATKCSRYYQVYRRTSFLIPTGVQGGILKLGVLQIPQMRTAPTFVRKTTGTNIGIVEGFAYVPESDLSFRGISVGGESSLEIVITGDTATNTGIYGKQFDLYAFALNARI